MVASLRKQARQNGCLYVALEGKMFLKNETFSSIETTTLYQERGVFGKMKMDPAKRAQTQNAGEVSSLQWFFSKSVEN
jgi:hypothetical protein